MALDNENVIKGEIKDTIKKTITERMTVMPVMINRLRPKYFFPIFLLIKNIMVETIRETTTACISYICELI